jgi:hypothetical protein
MLKEIRALALKAEETARTVKSKVARERAWGRADAAAWWYARHVEMLCGRPEVVSFLREQAEAIAGDEEARGHLERALARRRVDAWVLAGFAERRTVR